MSSSNFLSGGGELGAVTRSHNWSDSVLGAPESWPQSLRTTLSIILNSKFPMFLFWGPDLICFYNDAYRPSLGNTGKHPAVGKKGADLWPEIWGSIKPVIDNVLNGGEATFSEDQLLPIYRNGKLDDVYWTFSYSPVFDESGTPAGVFVTCTETTEKVLIAKSLTESLSLQQAQNEELATINEELTVTNEELNESRDELSVSNDNLEKLSNNISQAINVAKIDLWSADLSTGLISLSNRSMDNHGLDTGEIISYEQSLQLMDPEYRNAVDTVIQAAISNLGNFVVEYRIIPQNGEKPRWIRSSGQVYGDSEGKPFRISGLMMDITEQKDENQRKNDFIGMVSHELKTPLTSLSAYIQMLLAKAKKEEDGFAANALEKAKKQVGKMTTIINGFLNVSRLEAGKIHINHQRFDMKELVREVEEEVVPVNTSHHIIFHPVLTTWVNGDRDKIGQVITNFISNALKYSAPGTTIQISCFAADNASQVSVRDEGMGIADKDLGKLFDRYYRVEGHQMHTVAGFGIGLYLCSEIIERHSGKIWVESTVGKGSTFHFSIPIVD